MPKPKANDMDAFVGTRIRERRQLAGLSQTDLADKVGVTYQNVQKIESGNVRLSLVRAKAICEALSMTLDELFAGARKQVLEDCSIALPSQKEMELVRKFCLLQDDKMRTAIVAVLDAAAVRGTQPD